ncbi:hypothetical protein [Fimbriiglobus ruber]|uniref:Uncharacterized protein n=1 Tax=Fimbriiglobus ruber TaxID=1908690 RepID=A0A225E564_9BACT|nr:hypothetical protein [Fimbriiglobus ruber]OWK46904.1 hypothetical protein FRUB_00603 [Fimbriiglobus ruber]
MRWAILCATLAVVAVGKDRGFSQEQPAAQPPAAQPPGAEPARNPPAPPGFWVTFPNIPPLSKADQARVTEFVGQLGAADFRVREKAGRELAMFGERALPTLRAALKTLDDPEANRRLQIIVRKIDTDRLTGPRRVTLKMTNKSVKEILHQLAKKAGYPVQIQNVGDEKLRFSFEFDNTPFWEAVDRVCNAAGLVVSQNDEAGTLVFSFNDVFSPHVICVGPFRFTAQNINSSRQLQLGALNRAQPPARPPETLNLSVMVQSEPKAPIVRIGQVFLTKATDDQGKSMLAEEGPNDAQMRDIQEQLSSQINNGRSFSQFFNVMLVRGERSATSIKELRGKVHVGLHAENRPEITIDNVLTVKKKPFTGQTVRLELVTADQQMGVVTVDVLARPAQSDDQNLQVMNGLQQRFELTDENGARFELTDSNVNVNEQNGTVIRLVFTAPEGKKVGKPVRLQLMEWVTVTKEFEFSFKDIPLP